MARQFSRTHWFEWSGSRPTHGLLEFTSDHGVSTFTHEGRDYDLVGLLIDAALLPTQQFQVSDLVWIFEYDTPDPSRSIDRVDLDAPILVASSSEGQLTVIDGMHRLAKTVKLGHLTIKGIYISKDLLTKHRTKPVCEGASRGDQIMWAIHPQKGLIHKRLDTFQSHANWFASEGLPTSGAGFDRIPRGRIDIDHKNKNVVFIHHEGHSISSDTHRRLMTTYKVPKNYSQESHLISGNMAGSYEESHMDDVEKLLREAHDFAKGASTFGANPTKAYNNQTQKPTAQSKVKAVIDTALKKTAMKPFESAGAMISRIVEGNFDWQELERLYGADFKPKAPKKPKDVGAVKPHYHYPEAGDTLAYHGFMPSTVHSHQVDYTNDAKHQVLVNPHTLDWSHRDHHGDVVDEGIGLSSLERHLRNTYGV